MVYRTPAKSCRGGRPAAADVTADSGPAAGEWWGCKDPGRRSRLGGTRQNSRSRRHNRRSQVLQEEWAAVVEGD
jgi:hypothetical protein